MLAIDSGTTPAWNLEQLLLDRPVLDTDSVTWPASDAPTPAPPLVLLLLKDVCAVSARVRVHVFELCFRSSPTARIFWLKRLRSTRGSDSSPAPDSTTGAPSLVIDELTDIEGYFCIGSDGLTSCRLLFASDLGPDAAGAESGP